MTTDQLLAQVLELPRNERVQVAERLLSSLEEPESDIAEAWAAELDRRSQELTNGNGNPINWLTARDEILKELKQHRDR